MAGTIVQVFADKVPPKEHPEAIKKAYPKTFGFSCQHEGQLIAMKDKTAWDQSVDDILEFLKNTSGPRILYFGNPKTFKDENDVMPFVLTTSEDAPMVAMFFEGKFDKWIDSD